MMLPALLSPFLLLRCLLYAMPGVMPHADAAIAYAAAHDIVATPVAPSTTMSPADDMPAFAAAFAADALVDAFGAMLFSLATNAHHSFMLLLLRYAA